VFRQAEMKATIRNQVGRSRKETRSTQTSLTSQLDAGNTKRPEKSGTSYADDAAKPKVAAGNCQASENDYQQKTGQIKRDQFRE
jgi:hypothetical protein